MSIKVLIIDDEEDIRESLKLILSDHYELILTDGGEQALTVLANDKTIGVALLDIKIRKVHGLDVLKEIKTKYPKIKVIMITDYKSVETASESARLKAAGYIMKPFKVEKILETVKKNLK